MNIVVQNSSLIERYLLPEDKETIYKLQANGKFIDEEFLEGDCCNWDSTSLYLLEKDYYVVSESGGSNGATLDVDGPYTEEEIRHHYSFNLDQ